MQILIFQKEVYLMLFKKKLKDNKHKIFIIKAINHLIAQELIIKF